MKFVSQIIDMFFDACRRPTPVTELLPSNETIRGECTSRETIFSNQVIAAGTSKSSSQGSLYSGKISSSLECWLKHRPYLQVSLSLSLSHNAWDFAMWFSNFKFSFFFFLTSFHLVLFTVTQKFMLMYFYHYFISLLLIFWVYNTPFSLLHVF